MPPQPKTQTAITDAGADGGVELAAALDRARCDLARARAECMALRRRNELLEREMARLAAEGATREKARLRAFQAQKIEAIGQLSGGIAHDFNNLLAVVSGGLYLLPGALSDPVRSLRLIRRMEGAVGRGAEVTRRLLAFARRQLLRPERIDLGARADALAALLAPALGPAIVLRLQLAGDLWPVVADPAALELSLLNLAENACDAMPRGGSFTLTAGNLPLDGAAAEPAGLAAGDYVEIRCADSGDGMRPEVLARVFEPFFTTKPVGRGRGLGLPQVHGFAAQSGGTAWVESRAGAGTTVILLLRRAAACEPDAPVS